MDTSTFITRPLVRDEVSRVSRLETPFYVSVGVALVLLVTLSVAWPDETTWFVLSILIFLPLAVACAVFVTLRFEWSEELSILWGGYPLTARQLKLVRMTKDEDAETQVYAQPVTEFVDNVLVPSRANVTVKRYFRKLVQSWLENMSRDWDDFLESLSYNREKNVNGALDAVQQMVDDVARTARDIKTFKTRVKDMDSDKKTVNKDAMQTELEFTKRHLARVEVMTQSDQEFVKSYLPLWQGYATMKVTVLRNIMKYRKTLQTKRDSVLTGLKDPDAKLTNTHLDTAKLYFQAEFTEQRFQKPVWLSAMFDKFVSQRLADNVSDTDRERVLQSIRAKLEPVDVKWLANVLNHQNFRLSGKSLSVKDMVAVFNV